MATTIELKKFEVTFQVYLPGNRHPIFAKRYVVDGISRKDVLESEARRFVPTDHIIKFANVDDQLVALPTELAKLCAFIFDATEATND